MGLNERLMQLRKEKGYTRDELATILGISKYTLRNYEMAITEPGHTFLIQIANIFNVSIDYLMGLTEEKERVLPYNLKLSEYKHIEKYRTLDDHGKELIDIILDKEIKRVASLKTTARCLTNAEMAKIIAEIPETPEELERLYPPVSRPPSLKRKKPG